jgi:hypothetical protein
LLKDDTSFLSGLLEGVAFLNENRLFDRIIYPIRMEAFYGEAAFFGSMIF